MRAGRRAVIAQSKKAPVLYTWDVFIATAQYKAVQSTDLVQVTVSRYSSSFSISSSTLSLGSASIASTLSPNAPINKYVTSTSDTTDVDTIYYCVSRVGSSGLKYMCYPITTVITGYTKSSRINNTTVSSYNKNDYPENGYQADGANMRWYLLGGTWQRYGWYWDDKYTEAYNTKNETNTVDTSSINDGMLYSRYYTYDTETGMYSLGNNSEIFVNTYDGTSSFSDYYTLAYDSTIKKSEHMLRFSSAYDENANTTTTTITREYYSEWEEVQKRGSYINDVSDANNSAAYPNNGIQGEYWYVKI